jgi:hypothetical protein
MDIIPKDEPDFDYASKPSYYVLIVIFFAGLILGLFFLTAPYESPAASVLLFYLCGYTGLGCAAALYMILYFSWGFGLFLVAKKLVDRFRNVNRDAWVLFTKLDNAVMLGPVLVAYPATFFLNSAAQALDRPERYDAKEEISYLIGIVFFLCGIGGIVSEIALGLLLLYLRFAIPLLLVLALLLKALLFIKRR